MDTRYNYRKADTVGYLLINELQIMSLSTTTATKSMAVSAELPPNPATKPRMILRLTTTSPALSRSNPADSLALKLNVTLHYHKIIAINRFSTIFASCIPHLDFISLTREHDDVLAEDFLPKEYKEQYEEKEPIKLYWADNEDFINLDPNESFTTEIKLGPSRRPPSLPLIPKPKLPDGRWDFVAIKALEKAKSEQGIWDGGILGELETGAEYEIRLRDGSVKWWRSGHKDDWLRVYKRDGNWFTGWLLGQPFEQWRGEAVLPEESWIQLEVGGVAPRFRVVD